jgi:hypothetical protein
VVILAHVSLLIHMLVDITMFSPLGFIYNLAGSHLFGTRFIPIKISVVWFCQILKSIYALTLFPKVSQWAGLYLKQTRDS